jgi:hypothetical protein
LFHVFSSSFSSKTPSIRVFVGFENPMALGRNAVWFGESRNSVFAHVLPDLLSDLEDGSDIDIGNVISFLIVT